MTGRHKSQDYVHQPRRDRMYEPHVQDPYLAREKFSEPTVCPDCGAVFHTGRWQWGVVRDDAERHRCPACARTHDHVPAGILTLSGEFLVAHREEIMQLVHNIETREKAEHPLERIMQIETQDADPPAVIIAYTGLHLAKTTGEALHAAYQGEFNFSYADRDGVLHGHWQR